MSIMQYTWSGFMQLLFQLLIQSQYCFNKVLQYCDVMLRNSCPPPPKKKPVNMLSVIQWHTIKVCRLKTKKRKKHLLCTKRLKAKHSFFGLVWELVWDNACPCPGTFSWKLTLTSGTGGWFRSPPQLICFLQVLNCFKSYYENGPLNVPKVSEWEWILWIQGVGGHVQLSCSPLRDMKLSFLSTDWHITED